MAFPFQNFDEGKVLGMRLKISDFPQNSQSEIRNVSCLVNYMSYCVKHTLSCLDKSGIS